MGKQSSQHDWRTAAAWGFGISLTHRFVLQLWMLLTWLIGGRYLASTPDFQAVGASLPPLNDIEQLVFGIWRHWDAIHYLNLAQNGYNAATEDLSVFPPLTAWSIRALDTLLPGGVDFAGMVFATLSFGLALTFLFRLCQTYLPDDTLARWAVAATALFPLSHFFAAPMSEGLYLALVLGTFYFATQGSGWGAALCGFLATLTRTQGALLFVFAGLIMLEGTVAQYPTWRERLLHFIKCGWMLTLIPVAALLFDLFRTNRGFAPVSSIYQNDSYIFFTNPINGLWLNAGYFVAKFDLMNVDGWALIIGIVLLAALIVTYRTRHLPLTVYALVYFALFISKMNYAYGTDIVTNTQSLGRYLLVLFPFAILIGRWLQNSARWTRLAAVMILLSMVLILSSRHVVGLLGP